MMLFLRAARIHSRAVPRFAKSEENHKVDRRSRGMDGSVVPDFFHRLPITFPAIKPELNGVRRIIPW